MEFTVDKRVSGNLARLRLLRGLSQAELGQLSGHSRSQISKFESGESLLYASSLYKLSQALNVPVITFFDGLSFSLSPDGPETEIDFLAAMEFFAMFKAYQGLPTGKRKSVKNLVIRSSKKTSTADSRT